jgi:hypothetical protein
MIAHPIITIISALYTIGAIRIARLCAAEALAAIRKAAIQAYSDFLFWKWDREYHASVRRMHGCAHPNTVLVDVGAAYKKCRDCWALLVPALDGSNRMEWTPNGAPPRRSAIIGDESK